MSHMPPDDDDVYRNEAAESAWRPIFDREQLLDALCPMLAQRCPPPYDREGCPVPEGADWSCERCRAEWLEAIVCKPTDVPDVLPPCPECGGACRVEATASVYAGWSVHCDGHYAPHPVVYAATVAAAIAGWRAMCAAAEAEKRNPPA